MIFKKKEVKTDKKIVKMAAGRSVDVGLIKKKKKEKIALSIDSLPPPGATVTICRQRATALVIWYQKWYSRYRPGRPPSALATFNCNTIQYYLAISYITHSKLRNLVHYALHSQGVSGLNRWLDNKADVQVAGFI